MSAKTKLRRTFRLAGALAALVLFAAAVASSASAAVQWRVTSVHGPQNIAPGDTGQYVVQLYNFGDSATVDDNGTPEDPGDDVPLPVTATDTLPEGVVAFDAAGVGWDCSATSFPSGTVACTYESIVYPPGPVFKERGAVPALIISVEVEPGAAPGVRDNAVTVEGGGAADPATDIDPTPIGSAPAGFGFVPGSFTGDFFGAQFPTGSPIRQAGSHPFELRVGFDTNLKASTSARIPLYTEPEQRIRTLEIRLPRGFVGNPEATPKCTPQQLGASGPTSFGSCLAETQVGTLDLVLQDGPYMRTDNDVNFTMNLPLFNMVPPDGYVAAFGLSVLGNPVYILASLDPTDGYSVVTRILQTNSLLPIRSVQMRMWGVPADPAHDRERVNSDSTDGFTAFGGPSKAPIRPFLTLPGQCDSSAGAIEQRADSWQNPGVFTPWERGGEVEALGCEDPRVRFQPTITIQPTSHAAASPTGLDIDLSVPQKDDTVQNPGDLYAENGKDEAIVTPNLKDAVTHLPLGMAVNPSIANGLTGCTQAQVGLDDNEAPACPDNSRIGTVEIDSPLVPDTLQGAVYQMKPFENPHGSLLGFYTVARGNGLTIKLAARVDSDPETGQLTTTFLDNPQLAFSHYRLHFDGGQRAPLVNPPLCGTYSSTARFTAWNSSVAPVETGDEMLITSGPGGGPCPDSLAGRPFAPGFKAGSALPIAGAFSPFGVEATRADGEQELRTIETTLPPGMLGRLAGVPYCPEAAIASISTEPGTGLAQRLSPSCPAASLVGHSDAAAGAGALPFHNPGSVYLAGPYKGAPISLAIVTPVVAGPLDLGSIVVRAAAFVDPVSAQIRVVSDPIPDRIVSAGNGFPLNVRSVRVTMDRDGFTLNPTSCNPMAVEGTLGSLQGASAQVSRRFQVGACRALEFEPRLSVKVSGPTRRAKFPALRAVLKTKPGEANIARASVALPHSQFLEQAHIGTICTRVQYAAESCPAASVYGHARAFSPLLDKPLEGPIYLRSSNNSLPDLVASLDGQIHIDLAGRIDSKNEGIRTTFSLIPDAPVSKFVLSMKGGKKGLLVNSRNLCKGAGRLTVKMDGHNGKVHNTRPALKTSCGAKRGDARRHAKAAG